MVTGVQTCALPISVWEVAVQVLPVRVQRPGRRHQRQADDDGDHQGRGAVGGVGLDQVAPRNGAEPPQPGGVGVVGRGPQGEDDPQRAQGRPPRAPPWTNG